MAHFSILFEEMCLSQKVTKFGSLVNDFTSQLYEKFEMLLKTDSLSETEETETDTIFTCYRVKHNILQILMHSIYEQLFTDSR